MARRPGLDQRQIVRAAAALVDASGLENLNLGELAERLGVRTPSLYNHVAGLPALRRELTLLGLHELSDRLGRAAIGKSADAAVLAVGDAYRAFAREHPGLYAATQRAPDAADEEIQAAAREPIAVMLTILASFGLQGDAAIHAIRALRSVVHGFVSLESSGGFGIPLDIDGSFAYLMHMFLAGLHRAAQAPDETHSK